MISILVYVLVLSFVVVMTWFVRYTDNMMFQAINSLALVEDNKEKIVKAGAIQVYVQLLSPQYDESIHRQAVHGLLMLASKCKDNIIKERGCLEGQYLSTKVQ